MEKIHFVIKRKKKRTFSGLWTHWLVTQRQKTEERLRCSYMLRQNMMLTICTYVIDLSEQQVLNVLSLKGFIISTSVFFSSSFCSSWFRVFYSLYIYYIYYINIKLGVIKQRSDNQVCSKLRKQMTRRQRGYCRRKYNAFKTVCGLMVACQRCMA